MTQLESPPEVPLCTRCLKPVRPEDHYCPGCGTAVGQFTRYLPFESIRFEVDFLAAMWRRAWSREAGLLARIGALLLLLCLVPVLIVVLPFALWRRRRPPR